MNLSLYFVFGSLFPNSILYTMAATISFLWSILDLSEAIILYLYLFSEMPSYWKKLCNFLATPNRIWSYSSPLVGRNLATILYGDIRRQISWICLKAWAVLHNLMSYFLCDIADFIVRTTSSNHVPLAQCILFYMCWPDLLDISFFKLNDWSSA